MEMQRELSTPEVKHNIAISISDWSSSNFDINAEQ